jgi:hypothetical protein
MYSGAADFVKQLKNLSPIRDVKAKFWIGFDCCWHGFWLRWSWISIDGVLCGSCCANEFFVFPTFLGFWPQSNECRRFDMKRNQALYRSILQLFNVNSNTQSDSISIINFEDFPLLISFSFPSSSARSTDTNWTSEVSHPPPIFLNFHFKLLQIDSVFVERLEIDSLLWRLIGWKFRVVRHFFSLESVNRATTLHLISFKFILKEFQLALLYLTWVECRIFVENESRCLQTFSSSSDILCDLFLNIFHSRHENFWSDLEMRENHSWKYFHSKICSNSIDLLAAVRQMKRFERNTGEILYVIDFKSPVHFKFSSDWLLSIQKYKKKVENETARKFILQIVLGSFSVFVIKLRRLATELSTSRHLEWTGLAAAVFTEGNDPMRLRIQENKECLNRTHVSGEFNSKLWSLVANNSANVQ